LLLEGPALNKLGFLIMKSVLLRSVKRFGNIKTCIILLFLAVFLINPVLSVKAVSGGVLNGSQEVAVVSRSEAETFYLTAINDLRQEYSLKPLIIDSRLTESAYQKNQDMLNNNYWGHWSPKKSFSDFIWTALPKASSVGENLAKCYYSRAEALTALRASPTHLANMLGVYSNIGVSEITNNNSGCVYTTFHFALNS
jgi:uncharacterized protein YkwD